MNDLKFSEFTPKRVVLGTVGVLFFLFLVWGFRGYTQQSLGLSGSVTSASAPMVSYGTAMMARDAVMPYGDAYGEIAKTSNVAAPSMMPIATPPADNAKIVKTGSLSLLVDDVYKTADDITAIRVAMAGQPGNASFAEYQKGSRSGSITIWVPSDRFDEAVKAIKALALRVEQENENVQDVSGQYVDLEARLKTLRATEQSYITLLNRAGKISDVLDVTRELNNTRTQIEQLQGQLDLLSRKVALSSITVSLSEEAAPSQASSNWRPLSVIKSAAKQTLIDLQNLVDVVLVFLIKLPLLLLTLGFWIVVIWGLWRIGFYVVGRLKNVPPRV